VVLGSSVTLGSGYEQSRTAPAAEAGKTPAPRGPSALLDGTFRELVPNAPSARESERAQLWPSLGSEIGAITLSPRPGSPTAGRSHCGP
jgi:hypothetical protein